VDAPRPRRVAVAEETRQRGFDGGDGGAAAQSMDDYAGDIIDLLDGLHVHEAVVCGLSMGGTLALRLAQKHGSAVSGLVLVNPSVKADSPTLKAVSVLRHVVPSVKGIASDIALEGGGELGYDRTPLHAVYSLTRLWPLVRAGLPQVTQPLLVLHSKVDHVVHPSNSAIVLGAVSSADVTEKVLEHSFHVATLDNDAELIFAESYAFIERLSVGAGDAVKEGTAGG